jgi:hypothetical protein
MYTQQLSQRLGVVGSIHSASQSVGTALTEAIDLSKSRRFLFVVDVGALGASATVDFKVQGATTSGGTYTTIANTSIAQITTNNQVATVEITTEGVQALNLGYTYIKGALVVGTAASQASVVAYAADSRNEPTSKQNVSYVAAPIIL